MHTAELETDVKKRFKNNQSSCWPRGRAPPAGLTGATRRASGPGEGRSRPDAPPGPPGQQGPAGTSLGASKGKQQTESAELAARRERSGDRKGSRALLTLRGRPVVWRGCRRAPPQAGGLSRSLLLPQLISSSGGPRETLLSDPPASGAVSILWPSALSPRPRPVWSRGSERLEKQSSHQRS